MTDPDDDTQTHQTAPLDPAPPAGPPAAPATPGASLPPEPPVGSAPPPDAPAGSPPPREPSLQADPSAPHDSGWREPPWFPADARRQRRRERTANPFAILVGLAFIAIGAWYFLDRTLGIALPRIQWGSLWPLILIVLGGWILFQSMQRRP